MGTKPRLPALPGLGATTGLRKSLPGWCRGGEQGPLPPPPAAGRKLGKHLEEFSTASSEASSLRPWSALELDAPGPDDASVSSELGKVIGGRWCCPCGRQVPFPVQGCPAVLASRGQGSPQRDRKMQGSGPRERGIRGQGSFLGREGATLCHLLARWRWNPCFRTSWLCDAGQGAVPL